MLSMIADAQLRKGVVESCILGLLAREPMYGWQLSEKLTNLGMIASIGTLYPVLGRLRAKGYVVSVDETSELGPTRKYYHLAPSGKEQLARFRQQWVPFTSVVAEIIGGDDEHS